jgi:hypothetical protein
MKKNKIDVCGLSETKLVSSKLQLMHKLRLKQWRMFSNVEATSVARIVVLWNPSTVNVDSIDSSPQALHVIIRNLETQFTCAATFVYGYNSVSARRPLWDYLRRRAPSCPWDCIWCSFRHCFLSDGLDMLAVFYLLGCR